MVLLLHLSFHKPMKLTITIDISVMHPEEIWKNWFQLGGSWGGPKAELWWWFSKYKANNTCAGLKCILFILNVEIY